MESCGNHSVVRVLLVEPFYGGSHRQLMDTLMEKCESLEFHRFSLFTLPAKKWHWRARTSALHFAQILPQVDANNFGVLFASSVLNMAELIALRPDLRHLCKIIYVHENQLAYPLSKNQERDYQYGYNQILSCLVADRIVFNSDYNMQSFLTNVDGFLKKTPDRFHYELAKDIAKKSRVVYFPLLLPTMKTEAAVPSAVVATPVPTHFGGFQAEDVGMADGHQDVKSRTCNCVQCTRSPLHIVWPHRWEHDKAPEDFFNILIRLNSSGIKFTVSVLGQQFSEVPDIFDKARSILGDAVLHWGHVPDRMQYYAILQDADVAVSTAKHEFFGVAMIEAVHFGCYPLCPNRLVYPELFPATYLYNTVQQLFKRLKCYCHTPHLVRRHLVQMDVSRYGWEKLSGQYLDLFKPDAAEK